MSDDYKDAQTAELKRLLQETEDLAVELHAELQRRQEQEQHLQIDHLEDHLSDAVGKWSDLKRFFQLVLTELKQ